MSKRSGVRGHVGDKPMLPTRRDVLVFYFLRDLTREELEILVSSRTNAVLDGRR